MIRFFPLRRLSGCTNCNLQTVGNHLKDLIRILILPVQNKYKRPTDLDREEKITVSEGPCIWLSPFTWLGNIGKLACNV
jgi:hypothetical protein